MDIKDTTFMMGNMYSDSPHGVLSVPLDYEETNFSASSIDQIRYQESKNNKKKYWYYKVINFEFKKSLIIYSQKYSLHIGDIIDFITKHTGIKKLIIYLTKGNCGCEARRKKFNQWFFVKLPIIKFVNHSYSDKVDITLKITEKKHKELINKINFDTTVKQTKEQLKQEMFEKLYGNVSGVKEKPNVETEAKKGCGCGAKGKKTNLTKRVNIV